MELNLQQRDSRALWALSAQWLTLVLIALALWWATPESNTSQPPKIMLQALLEVFGLVALVLVLLRKPSAVATQLLGGVTLATAVWLSSIRTFISDDSGAWGLILLDTPLIAPVAILIGLVIFYFAAQVGAGVGRSYRLGAAALWGGLLIATLGMLYFWVINAVPPFSNWYMVEPVQFVSLLTAALLYPLMLWLGGAGVSEERPSILPWGIFVILSWYAAHWTLLGFGR